MAYTVGQAEVLVVPNANNFNERLRAQLANTPDVSLKVDPDTGEASASLDRFYAETEAKAKVTGDAVGKSLTSGAASSAKSGSPLIMAAITGGLLAGGPAVLAASTLMFGGIAAAVAAQSPQVKAAFANLMTTAKADLQTEAAGLAPTFDLIAAHATAALQSIEPSVHAALTAVAPDVLSLTDAFEHAAETALPAFTRAIQSGQPVVQGLDTLIKDVGTGVAGFMDQITAHGGAAGSVLSDLGQILDTALPAIGQLIGEGAELGAQILPPVATALHLVADALNIVAPVLPEVVLGFAGFKVISALSGPLGTFSAKMQTVAADSEGLASSLSGRLAGAAAGLGSALPVVGVGVGLVAAALPSLVNWLTQTNTVIPKVTVNTQGMNAALAQSKGAIDSNVTSAASLALQQGGLFKAAQQWGISTGTLTQAVLGNKDAMVQVQAAAANYKATQDGAAKSTATQADQTGIAADAYKRAGMQSDSWLQAIQRLAGGTDSQIQKQKDLALAVDGASTSEQTNQTRLQGIATDASNANTQISLLSGALKALTGTQVSEMEAQAAVTSAVDAAKTALQGQTGALWDANKGTLDLTTSAGVAAFGALNNMASADDNLIGTMEKHGATTDQVTAKDAALRDQFIQTAKQMGFTADQAGKLADQILGIPTQRKTEISADTSQAVGQINGLINTYNGRTIAFNVNAGPAGGTGGPVAHMQRAMGGPIAGPGTGTSDSVLVAASNGEHMWTASEVQAAGGHSGVQAIRQAVLNAGGGRAKGGPIDLHTYVDPGSLSALNSGIQAFGQSVAQRYAVANAGVSGVPASRSANEAAVQAVANGYGWGSGAQWNDLVAVIMRESGFNNVAQNPTSTAYGMFQFLNSTWGGYPYGKTSDPHAQSVDGLMYIRNRYGSPAGAYAHEQSFGWYDQGGLLPPGPSLVYNGTGAPELVAPQKTFQQVMSGATGGPAEPVVITGTVAFDPSGLITFTDARIDRSVGALADTIHYTGA